MQQSRGKAFPKHRKKKEELGTNNNNKIKARGGQASPDVMALLV